MPDVITYTGVRVTKSAGASRRNPFVFNVVFRAPVPPMRQDDEAQPFIVAPANSRFSLPAALDAFVSAVDAAGQRVAWELLPTVGARLGADPVDRDEIAAAVRLERFGASGKDHDADIDLDADRVEVDFDVNAGDGLVAKVVIGQHAGEDVYRQPEVCVAKPSVALAWLVRWFGQDTP